MSRGDARASAYLCVHMLASDSVHVGAFVAVPPDGGIVLGEQCSQLFKKVVHGLYLDGVGVYSRFRGHRLHQDVMHFVTEFRDDVQRILGMAMTPAPTTTTYTIEV